MLPVIFVGFACAVAFLAMRPDDRKRGVEARRVRPVVAAAQSAAATVAPSAANPAGRRRFCILHNPAAGRNYVGLARAVAAALRAQGATVEFLTLTERLPPAAELARRYDAVVVSGGDGSIRSVAGALGAAVPLAIIANGTGNVMAAELALPRRSAPLAKLLAHGPVRRLHGGTVDGVPFFLMVGAGFDGDVVGAVSRRTLQRLGKLAYVRPVLAAVLRPPRPFVVEIDAARTTCSWMIVSNVQHYGGLFRLTSQTSLCEPGMVALISRATTRRQRLAELFRLAAGRFEAAPTVEARPASRVRLLTGGVAAQVDGEPLPPGPFEVTGGPVETDVIAV